jgi:hypothetical protein
MKKSKEKDELAGIIKLLLLDGWLVVRLNSGSFKISGRFFRAYIIENLNSSAGAPDLLAWKKNKFLLIEVKRRKHGRIEDSQKTFKSLAESKGIPFLILDRWEDLLPYLDMEIKGGL